MRHVTSVTLKWESCKLKQTAKLSCFSPGGVRHDPQRIMCKTVYVPHFNHTVEFASSERSPGVKTLLPFLKKNMTEESDLDNSQDLIAALDACYWLHKVISIRLSRLGDDRRCDLGGDLLLLRRF